MEANESLQAIHELRNQINLAVDSYESLHNIGATKSELDRARRSIHTIAEQICQATSNPYDTAREMGYQCSIHAIIRIAIDLDIFKIIASHGPLTATQIHERTGGDATLIFRFLRVLSAAGYIRETGKQTFAASPLTKALNADGVWAMCQLRFDFMLPVEFMFPKFLKDHDYHVPDETAYHQTYGQEFFEFLTSKPEQKRLFDMAMTYIDHASLDTFPPYPFAAVLQDVDSNEVSIVDVGGGRGQWFKDLPNLPGRMILQDLDGTINALDRSSPLPFEAMVHNFFTPQPIHGARLYHLRFVLHDWSDSKALSILRNLAAALDHNKSRLLINERVLPDVGCGLQEAVADLRMMKFGGLERSEWQWQELIGAAGFEILKICRAKQGHRAIIECKLRSEATT